MVNKVQKEKIEKEVQVLLFRYFLSLLALIGGLFGLSVWGIYGQVERITIERISSQFKEPQIQKLLKEVASNEAKSIIEGILNPEIAKINKVITSSSEELEEEIEEVKKETKYFKDFIEGTRLSFSKEFDTLAEQVNFLKQRNALTSLADEAISQGNASLYEKLQCLPVDEKLQNAKLSEILRVKNYYATMTRIKGLSINTTEADGRKTKDDEISTGILLKDLANNADWKIRARAAELLKKRNENGVVEALKKSAQTDPRLDVRKLSLDALAGINNVQFIDVLDYNRNIGLLPKDKNESEKNTK